MFKKDSGLVKIWFGAVLNGTYQYKDVPNLSNLQQVVGEQLTDMGYDINAENAAA
ncbi:hypothetical protein [Cytobacillus praedii]|uniref:hypothetical protein n=1 Tax=Cytobacillus praedii TaxID=1742358 RepID=UPI002E209114|nr:hypothetical protein [Cytobacillus praedii]